MEALFPLMHTHKACDKRPGDKAIAKNIFIIIINFHTILYYLSEEAIASDAVMALYLSSP